MSDSPLTELQELWHQQNAEIPNLSLDAIRQQAALLERRGERAMSDAMLAFAFIAVGCVGFMILFQNLLLRVGATLTAMALGMIAIQAGTLRVRDRQASAYAAENGDQSTIDFLRSQLERRRERHRGWRFWMRWVVLLPGPITFFFGFAQARPDLRLMILFEFLTFVVAMVAAIPLNRQASRSCERRLRALDQLRESSCATLPPFA